MEYNGRFYGKELIDWAIRDAETTHKGQVAVIVADRFANMHPGDAEENPLALQYFVPKTPEGEQAAMTFVIDSIGYDYWALSWDRLEEIADLRETISVILAEAQVVWAASEAERSRFYALKERLFRHLADPQYICRILAERLDSAMTVYRNIAFEEDVGAVRMGARFIGIYLGDAVAAANGTYLKRGGSGTDDPVPVLKTLERVPAGYIELQEKVYTERESAELIELCRKMILAVRKFLKEMLPGELPEPATYPQGWYEELIYTWRRIRYFCDHGDAANAFGWAGYLQEDIGMLGGLVTEEERNILRDFDADDLQAFAARCEEARALIYERLKERGIPLREYDTLEDFLKENGEDEV